MSKVALITGITGQDGSYLAEFLLKKGYVVHGLKRRASSFNTLRIDHIYRDPHGKNCKMFLHYGDMTDSDCLNRLIDDIQPDEVYNLAAMSHVHVSFLTPKYTADVDGVGVLSLLEAIRKVAKRKKIKFYQASTSEMFGDVKEIPQKETTPFNPQSPYAVAKVYGYWITRNYRDAYNLFTCNGILFNHSSPRRGETFVLRKIVMGAVRIKRGVQKCLYLGNLDAKRDIGHAKDYIEAMWMMLQADQPQDYIVSTGETHSIRDYTNYVFDELEMHLTWEGKGVDEIGKHGNIVVVRIDTKYYRPTEVEFLLGDSSKIRSELGWKPKYTIRKMISEMVDEEMKKLS